MQIIFVLRAATYEKRVEEHKHSVIGKHFDDERDLRHLKLRRNFNFFFTNAGKSFCASFLKSF